MNQEHKDIIINMVNEIGISNTLDIIGGDKDIIRKVYIDYPESYLDYLIGNLYPMKDTYGLNRWVYEYKVNILHYEDSTDTILIDDYIWNYFYKSVMQFDDRTIEFIFTKWLYKHYPKLSERKPIPYTDWWDMEKKISALADNLFSISGVPKDYLG
jgi:hypothetical protein